MSTKRYCAGTVGDPKNPNLGNPCRRWAVNGSDHCAVHGGVDPSRLSASTAPNQCTARALHTGERCRNSSIKGGTVCRFHGGAASQVKRKARERFNDLIDPMINIAEKLTEEALAGRMSHSDQMRLVTFIADRTGYVAGRDYNVEIEVKPWQQTMERIVRAVPIEEVEAGFPGQEPIEAEIVEDEIEPVRARDLLPQIVPPSSSNQRATIRIGSPIDRPRRRNNPDSDD